MRLQVLLSGVHQAAGSDIRQKFSTLREKYFERNLTQPQAGVKRFLGEVMPET